MSAVIVKTKSNFKNCNGILLTVKYAKGQIITCMVPQYGFSANGDGTLNVEDDTFVSADFCLKEIISLYL